MIDEKINETVKRSLKWSSITEIVAKIMLPITNIVLARILAPESFGIIATITMIISFVDIFSDAGFQKYLIQKDFANISELYKSANVAFFSSFTISIVIWFLMFISREQLAIILGSTELSEIIPIASLTILISSFSNIQIALLKRKFDFKALFLTKLIGVFIPIFSTIPLALLGYNYWSIIIGNILVQISNALILGLKSEWKPSLEYSFSLFFKMFKFSSWSLLEAIAVWLTIWIDTFIIGYYFTNYYLGLYKNSISLVNAGMTIITATFIPVLFSILSRVQKDNKKYKEIYLEFQKNVAILVMPLGVLLFVFRDFVTLLILGDKWIESSLIIGLWGLTSSINIIFGHFCSEAYRSKGRPDISFYIQIIHLLFLIPTILISIKYGFLAFVFCRTIIRMQLIISHVFIFKKITNINYVSMVLTTKSIIIACFMMFFVGFFLESNQSVFWIDILNISICIVIYICFLYVFKDTRVSILHAKKIVSQKLKRVG